MREHSVSFRKSGKKWKLTRKDELSKRELRTKKGESVVWEAEDSDIYFQFHDAKLFGEHTVVLKKGQKLKLKVGENAPKGSHVYAAFFIEDREYAEENSPPIIIVE